MLRVVELRGTTRLFPENVIDISKSLFKHVSIDCLIGESVYRVEAVVIYNVTLESVDQHRYTQ